MPLFSDCVCMGQLSLAFLFSLQNEMCLATQQLSKQLLAYEKQVDDIYAVSEAVLGTLFSGTLLKAVLQRHSLGTDFPLSLPLTLHPFLPPFFFFFPILHVHF